MTKSLTRLLGKIVGRIRKNMGAYYLTVGAIFVPTGFIILLETHNKGMAGLAFALGTLALFWGIRHIQRDEQIENDKWEYQTRIQLGMLEELRKLRGEADDNSDDKPKPT